jgi:16S rRNA (cytosine1402-N4)-methyltransferase
LGVSSPHLDEASRGFSLLSSGPLDMRMDDRQELTAAHLVNHASQLELTEMIRSLGEDSRAEQIAQAIIAHRPLTSTEQLATVIADSVPRRFGRRKIHPATKTFQALRIAVNDELNQLSRGLPIWGRLLAPGGRLVVISFHSLEDRIVKQFMAEHTGNRYDAEFDSLTKKPVVPSQSEIASNPRARSAKLRACSKK